MPDLQNFAVTRGANANLTVPTWTIAGEIRNSQTGALLRTFSVSFPQVLGQLTAAQQDELVASWVQELLKRRFPVEFGG